MSARASLTDPQMTYESAHRHYFALWPDEELRARLAKLGGEIAADAGGCAVIADQLHVTLAHIGVVRSARVADLRNLAAELAFERVELEFTRIEYWPEVKLAALVCDRRPDALLRFVRSVHSGLIRLGLLQHEFEYHPHVTLARELTRDSSRALARPIYWRADHFVLVEARASEAGVEHRVLDAWQGAWTRECCTDA